MTQAKEQENVNYLLAMEWATRYTQRRESQNWERLRLGGPANVPGENRKRRRQQGDF